MTEKQKKLIELRQTAEATRHNKKLLRKGND